MTTTPVGRPALDASAYAAAVRRELDDLGGEVVEELTGGLEADLADLAKESEESLTERLGLPSAYASELRQAAGLPPRPSRRLAASQWNDLLTQVRSQPWWPRLASVGADLRPVWWVARGVAAAYLVVLFFGLTVGLMPWLVALAMVAGSITLGRIWLRHNDRRLWQRALLLVGNLFALIVLPAVLPYFTPMAGAFHESAGTSYQPGLALDGSPVTNVFPYGPDGRPLQGITLLDQNGHPLAIDPDGASTGSYLFKVPAHTTAGEAWNVYPLSSAVSDDPELENRTLVAPTLPVALVPTVLPTATGSVTPTSTVTATAPAPTPSASTPTPTPTASSTTGG